MGADSQRKWTFIEISTNEKPAYLAGFFFDSLGASLGGGALAIFLSRRLKASSSSSAPASRAA